MPAPRSFVRIVGLHVTDPPTYAEYRRQMRPILLSFGADFEFDFTVSEVLRQPVPAPINRVFSLVFPSREACDRFFADPAYLAVRARYFEPAVGSITQIYSS